MNRKKVLTTILIIVALILGTALLLNNTNLFDHTKSNISSESLNKDTQNDIINNDTSLSTSSKASGSTIKEVPKAKKLESFTEGVWIKKYPENYACFKFETPEGIKIVADPYMMNEIVEPNIVTESHQHSDHTDISKLQGTYKLIKETEMFNENGINITGYPGEHNKGDTSETNIIFAYEINGIKIVNFASQGEMLGNDQLDKMKNADVLLIQGSIKPEYANSKLNLAEIKYIIDKLNPKVVIPEHGSENLGKALASYLGLKVEFIKGGEIVVTRSELDAAKSLRVLDLDIDVPKN